MGELKGTLTLLFLVANTTWHCAILYVLAIIRLPLTGGARAWLETLMDRWVIDPWVAANRSWFKWLRLCEVRVTYAGELGLGRDHWYMVVSNHQSWTDIVLLQTVLRADLPPVKFFTKQQLIWVPLLGLAMYLLGFPYVRRISREERERNPELANADRDNTLAACDGFRSHPTAVLNFLEGTRFTREKHLRQPQPAYRGLLNPRIGGLGYVLQGLSSELHCLVDVTIDYPDGVPAFWQFLKGECRAVDMRIETRAIPSAVADPEHGRDALGDWVNAIWQEKDHRIAGSREPLA
jgi:1-acyl-sn-glycerol-3-phosphate acyltransferase